jgi:hypothetical protein
MSAIDPVPWDGVPLQPERDGWHWLLAATNKGSEPDAACWDARRKQWFFQGTGLSLAPEEISGQHSGYLAYLGPCLPPSEVATLRAETAAAWDAGREAATEVFARPYEWKMLTVTVNGNAIVQDGCTRFVTEDEHNRVLRLLHDSIRALPLQRAASAALTAVVDRVRAEEAEAIARLHDQWGQRCAPDTIARARHEFCAKRIRERNGALVPHPAEAVPDVMQSRHRDALDAGLAVVRWMDAIAAKLPTDKHSSIERRVFALGNGGVDVVWHDNKPVAIAVFLRDEMNFTVMTRIAIPSAARPMCNPKTEEPTDER